MSMKYRRLKERALYIFLKKLGVQSRRISEILALTDRDIEAVRSYKYLQNLTNNANEETEETKTRITAGNTAHSLVHTTYRCKQIHRNNKIRLYETLMNQYCVMEL
jgi:uncharacterized membrane protein YgaE (UPF0421/DUF939 family)